MIKKCAPTAMKRRSSRPSGSGTGYDDNLVRFPGAAGVQPTINIEGLVAGYTGPGGKTVLPHRAVAKIDMRLVPDMTDRTRWRSSRRIWPSTASGTSRSS